MQVPLETDSEVEPRAEPQGEGLRQPAEGRATGCQGHVRVADQRLGHLHKLGSKLIGANQTVVLEDPNLSGTMKNRRPARSIADAGWRLFRTLPESEAWMDGRQVRIINGWLPTSQPAPPVGIQGEEKGLVRPCPDQPCLWR